MPPSTSVLNFFLLENFLVLEIGLDRSILLFKQKYTLAGPSLSIKRSTKYLVTLMLGISGDRDLLIGLLWC